MHCYIFIQGFRIACEKGSLIGHKVTGVRFVLQDGKLYGLEYKNHLLSFLLVLFYTQDFSGDVGRDTCRLILHVSKSLDLLTYTQTHTHTHIGVENREKRLLLY